MNKKEKRDRNDEESNNKREFIWKRKINNIFYFDFSSFAENPNNIKIKIAHIKIKTRLEKRSL